MINPLHPPNWTKHQSALLSIAAETQYTAPSKCRLVRIQADDGDLLVEFGTDTTAPASPTTGSLKVYSGTSETFPVADKGQLGTGYVDLPAVKLTPVTGTVHGQVLWGS